MSERFLSKIVAIIVAVSYLLPPGVCLCAEQGAPVLRQVPTVQQVSPKGCKKCGHCRQAPPSENPAKEHVPSCPAVKKLDSLRGLDAFAAVDAPEPASEFHLLAEMSARPVACSIDSPSGSDPPKRLLYCTLLI